MHSVNFDDSSGKAKIIYNTKEVFSVTQDFDRTFPLDPDEPGICIELVNTLSESVRLTLLFDDEVESSETISPGTRIMRQRSYFSHEVSTF